MQEIESMQDQIEPNIAKLKISLAATQIDLGLPRSRSNRSERQQSR